jgi:hypothetical protein
MDRRTTVKWVLAAAGAMAGPQPVVYGLERVDSDAHAHDALASKGYGSDPELSKAYKPGELWPLTLSGPQRETARVLCDLIIPADSSSASASDVGVVDFIDEWISAPYPQQRQDRPTILKGLMWLDKEAASRYAPSTSFAALAHGQQTAICDDICLVAKAEPSLAEAAKFFARYRDLTAGGFYTTPQGRQELRYVGNVAMTRFDGPPPEVLKKVGLA